MLIIFLRHAEAEDEATSDFARKLTAKGLEQAAKVGKFLLRGGLLPDTILTSPVVRAMQTAKLVASALDREVIEIPQLACGMSPAACLRVIEAYPTDKCLLLVGHEPDFSHAIGQLIGLQDSRALKIRKASLTAITLQTEGPAELQFSIPVRLM